MMKLLFRCVLKHIKANLAKLIFIFGNSCSSKAEVAYKYNLNTHFNVVSIPSFHILSNGALVSVVSLIL
jgi:hypothetical protein